LWDKASGKPIASFPHEDSVNYVSFSADGALVLTASADKTAKLWEVNSGKVIASFTHEGAVRCATFSPDGTEILTASADNTAKLWDAVSGKLVASFVHPGTVRCATFSPNGALILTASWDKTAKLWDADTPRDLAQQLKASAHSITIRRSAVSPATSPELQTDWLSDIASGLHFSQDGSLLAVSEERRSQLTKESKERAGSHRPSARFIRWFFSTGDNRTIFPASEIKMAEWVDNALLTNPNVSEGWLRNALSFLPDHPLLHIALARFEPDSVHADFLRSFGLARLPKNRVFCERAGQMLLDQHRPEMALVAIDQALLVDPTDAQTQRLRLKVLDVMPR
jgi:hypothetical protein